MFGGIPERKSPRICNSPARRLLYPSSRAKTLKEKFKEWGWGGLTPSTPA